jgi:hypothetical protein
MWNRKIGLLAGAGLFFAGSLAWGADTNLALGKPCSANVPPSYNTTLGKIADLTDGAIPQAQGTKVGWVSKGMVGWQNWIRKARTIQITVDLGEVRPIGGAALASAGGGGIVTFPASILVQTSEDGKTFLTAGDLVELDENGPIPMHGSATFHTFRTMKLHTKGRYVRFMCVVPTTVFSCGEVQVYQGQADWLNEPASGKAMTEDAAVAPLRLTQLGVRRRVLQDIQLVRGADKGTATSELDRLENEAREQTYPEKLDGFEADWPVNELDRKILAVRGRLLAKKGLPPLTIWRTPPYEAMDLLAQPPAKNDVRKQKVVLAMMLNEHRARSFNLTNASDQPAQVKFRLSGLPGGINPAYVQVYQVQWLDTREGRPRDMALKPLSVKQGWYETTVPAGLTRQVWLSFYPKEAKPGHYAAGIELSSGQWSGRMGLDLSIAPVRFPDQADFTLTMWDYLFDKDRSVTDGNRAAMKELFLSRMGNMPWLNWLRIKEMAQFDAEGNLAGPVDYGRWDAFVKFWPGVRHYATFLSTKDLFAEGSPQYKKAVASFAADWARHNKTLGLKPGQVVVAFGDEPRTDAMFARQAMLAEAFGAGTRDILIHINPTPRDFDKMPHARGALEKADVIMPPRSRLDDAIGKPQGQLYQALRKEGKAFWSYSCWGAKQFPASYYRLQPWTLFAQFGRDGNGEGFWALGDSSVSSNWNDYTAYGRVDYSPIYIAPDRAATSKLWEATREGVEDWQYLKMLADGGRADEAEKIAREVYDQVRKTWGGSSYGLTPASDPASHMAERGRLEALDLLGQAPRP